MKKICLILLILIMCGCNSKKDDPIDEPIEKEEIPTRQDVLLEQARIMYNDTYSLTEENIGTHFTPLRSIETEIKYAYLFDGCNKNTTGINYTISKNGTEIKEQTILYLVCENKMTMYYYDDLSEGAEPIDIFERAIEN